MLHRKKQGPQPYVSGRGGLVALPGPGSCRPGRRNIACKVENGGGMVKVHKRAVLDVVQEAPDSGAAGVPATTAGPGAGAARPSPKDHGFAVLFAACVELQDLLRCAEEERDGLRAENSALLRHVHQLQARCLELYARVRELEGAGNGDGSPPPALPHNSGTPNDDARRTSKPASAARASPLQALLRSGNVLVDSSSEGLGGGCQRVGDSFSDGHGDGDVNRDEIPMGNQIWALMDQSVRLRIEQWVVEQGRAVTVHGPPSEQRSLDGGGSVGRSSTRYSTSRAPSATDYGSITHGGALADEEGLLSLCDDDSCVTDADCASNADGSTDAEWPLAELVAAVSPPHRQAVSRAAAQHRTRSDAAVRTAAPSTRRAQPDGKRSAKVEDGECGGGTKVPRDSEGDALWGLGHAVEVEWGGTMDTGEPDLEKQPSSRRHAAQHRRGRLRAGAEAGTLFVPNQTLFGRIMAGMQDRMPGVLPDVLTPDLRDDFASF